MCSCLPTCLPSWLGCCVRPLGLVLFLSPNLSPILAGVLRPPPWSRLVLVSGLVSQLVSGLGCCVHSFLRSCLPTSLRSGMLCPPSLVSFCSCLPTCLVLRPPPWSRLAPVWDAVSASLVLSCSCLRSCLPASWPPVWHAESVLSCSYLPTCFQSWLGRCVRLPGLVLLLSPVLSPNLSLVWDAVSASLVLSCSCLRSCLPTCLRSRMLRLPPYSRLALVSQLVSHLGWGAASASLVSSFSCLRSCLPTCLRSGMLCPSP